MPPDPLHGFAPHFVAQYRYTFGISLYQNPSVVCRTYLLIKQVIKFTLAKIIFWLCQCIQSRVAIMVSIGSNTNTTRKTCANHVKYNTNKLHVNCEYCHYALQNKTEYTSGSNEQLLYGCSYQISVSECHGMYTAVFTYIVLFQLTSTPRNHNNNTIVVTQSTRMPNCRTNFPGYHISVTRDTKTSRNQYTVHLFLESDPAALQALHYFLIFVSGYNTQKKIADKFVSL